MRAAVSTAWHLFLLQAWVNGATNCHFIKLQARLQAWLHDRGKKGVWFEDNLAGESAARCRHRCCRRRPVVVSVVSVVVVVVVLVLVLLPPPPASALCDAVHPRANFISSFTRCLCACPQRTKQPNACSSGRRRWGQCICDGTQLT